MSMFIPFLLDILRLRVRDVCRNKRQCSAAPAALATVGSVRAATSFPPEDSVAAILSENSPRLPAGMDAVSRECEIRYGRQVFGLFNQDRWSEWEHSPNEFDTVPLHVNTYRFIGK